MFYNIGSGVSTCPIEGEQFEFNIWTLQHLTEAKYLKTSYVDLNSPFSLRFLIDMIDLINLIDMIDMIDMINLIDLIDFINFFNFIDFIDFIDLINLIDMINMIDMT
jgi:hypothetical protein